MTHQYYKNFLRNLRLIVKCGICGHKQKIEFHHIKPTTLNGQGRGLWRRAKDIREHPDAYLPLCYFCHRKVTAGEIAVERDAFRRLYWFNLKIPSVIGWIQVI